MTRVTRCLCRCLSAAVLGLVVLTTGISAQPSREVLIGRLATVEPSAARITMVVEGEVELRALGVDAEVEIKQGDRELTLSELVVEVGRRVTINYRVEDGRVVATTISVEPA